MGTSRLCRSEGHKHGGRKVTGTSVIEMFTFLLESSKALK